VHAFLEGTTCLDLVRELGRSPLADSNELFDIATSFASEEEAVGAIFDGKKGKRSDDAPAEGSKSREPHRKDKRGKKGKKPDAEALAVDPIRLTNSSTRNPQFVTRPMGVAETSPSVPRRDGEGALKDKS
jgi:hypothetical protein